MPHTYRIYGHGDHTPDGFPTRESLAHYVAGRIFSEYRGRYRYSEVTDADTIVLSREGLAFGHFEIDHSEAPTPEDKQEYPKTERVFIVKESTSYELPVRLKGLNLHVKQRGLAIDESQFRRIIDRAGKTQ